MEICKHYSEAYVCTADPDVIEYPARERSLEVSELPTLCEAHGRMFWIYRGWMMHSLGGEIAMM